MQDGRLEDVKKISLFQRQRIKTWDIQCLLQHPGKRHFVERGMTGNIKAILEQAERHWKGSRYFCCGAFSNQYTT